MCDFVVLSVVDVCADYGGVNVFHVCLNIGVVYGVGVCGVGVCGVGVCGVGVCGVGVCGVVCVVVCCLFLSGCCLLCWHVV